MADEQKSSRKKRIAKMTIRILEEEEIYLKTGQKKDGYIIEKIQRIIQEEAKKNY